MDRFLDTDRRDYSTSQRGRLVRQLQLRRAARRSAKAGVAAMNPTNNPALRSWVPVAPDSPFPIQNLPYGIFQQPNKAPHVGAAIGEFVLDLTLLEEENLLP